MTCYNQGLGRGSIGVIDNISCDSLCLFELAGSKTEAIKLGVQLSHVLPSYPTVWYRQLTCRLECVLISYDKDNLR
jgi:hypothetical protein